MELKNYNKNEIGNKVTIYHQNIRCVTSKSDELIINLQLHHSEPQIICLTEHHLKTTEIRNFSLNRYTLASSFCRKDYIGGMYINK